MLHVVTNESNKGRIQHKYLLDEPTEKDEGLE